MVLCFPHLQVQSLVEICLTHNLSYHETETALTGLGVPAPFISLVWTRLERENPAFFKTYYAQGPHSGTLPRSKCLSGPATSAP